MSQTYSLVCHETKQRLWIGQGTGFTNFYSGEPKTMENLKHFLADTLGKPLVLICDDSEGYDLDYDEYTVAARETPEAHTAE